MEDLAQGHVVERVDFCWEGEKTEIQKRGEGWIEQSENTKFEFLWDEWVSEEGLQGFKSRRSLGALEVDNRDRGGGGSNVG